MELQGSISTNLRSAIGSSARLRGRPVYQETIDHWRGLLAEGYRVRMSAADVERARIDPLIERLEAELLRYE